MKTTYNFSGSTDRYRRFDSFAEHVGNTESGKAVYVWRDGLWTISEHCAASTFYIATRTTVADIFYPYDTKAAREALARLIAQKVAA